MIVAELFAKLGLRPDKESFSQGEKLIHKVKHALELLVAVETVKFFGETIYGIYETTAALTKLAPQVGLSVESLQQFKYAAGVANVSVEEFTGSLGKYEKNAVAAANGSEEQRKAFKALGIDYKGLANGSVRVDESLLQLADRFQKMPDGPQKTAAAMAVFGRSGKALIPLLNQGRAGLQAMGQEAIDLGLVVKKHDAEAMEEFEKTVNRVKGAIGGFITQLAIQLLPVLEQLGTQMLDWIKANKDLIKIKIQEFAERLTTGIHALGDAFAWVMTHGDDVKTFLTVLAAAFTATQVAAVAAAAATMLAWAPVIAALLAAVTAIQAIRHLDDNKSGPVTSDVHDYEASDPDRAWYQKPSDWVAGKLAQRDEDSFTGKSRINWARSGANADKVDAGRKMGWAKWRQGTAAYLGNKPQSVTVPVAPQAMAANQSFSPNITINGSSDPKEAAKQVNDVITDFWNSKMRFAGAAQ